MLANMLAALPQFSAVKVADHQGVHESIFFSHFAKAFGPWSEESCERFKTAFAQSDYFLLTGFDTIWLDTVCENANSFGDVFVQIMDSLAQKEGSEGWLEKSPHHTLLADELRAIVPDCKLVFVQRDTADLVWSRLHGFGRSPKAGFRLCLDTIRGSMVATQYARYMKKNARKERSILVSYEDLIDTRSKETKVRLLQFLEIEAAPKDLQSRFDANSSFANNQTKMEKRFFGFQFLVRLGISMGHLFPMKLFAALQARKLRPENTDWPDWCWKRTGFKIG